MWFVSEEEVYLFYCVFGDKWLYIEGICYEVFGVDVFIVFVDVYVVECYSGLKGVGKMFDMLIYMMFE